MKKKFSNVIVIAIAVYIIAGMIDTIAASDPNWNGELSWFSSAEAFFVFVIFVILTLFVYRKELFG